MIAAAVALGLTGFGLCRPQQLCRRRPRLCRAARPATTAARPRASAIVVGTRLCFADGTPDIVAYPTDRDAYGRLCKLLTIGNLRGEKGAPLLNFDDLAPRCLDIEGRRPRGRGLHRRPALHPPCRRDRIGRAAKPLSQRLPRMAPGRVWLAAACTFEGNDRARLNRLADLGRRARRAAARGQRRALSRARPPHAAGRGDLHPRAPDHREAGRRLEQNAERHIKPPAEMARLFREHPEAIAETAALRSAASASASTSCKYNYPDETIGNGETAQETLERLTWEGASEALSATAFPTTVKRSALVSEL